MRGSGGCLWGWQGGWRELHELGRGNVLVGCRGKSSETLQTSEDGLPGGAENDAEGFKLFSLTFLAENSHRRQMLLHSRIPQASSSRSWNSDYHCAASSCSQPQRSSRSLWLARAGVLGSLRPHHGHCPQVIAGSGVCYDAARSSQRRHY